MSQPEVIEADLVVIGGGAAGIFGAIIAASNNPALKILVLEGSSRFLTKVEISGGGRCNVTHACYEPKKLIENYPRGAKELLGLFTRFQPLDSVEWFKSRGVELKSEDDGRIFPVTDSSKTILDCLLKESERLGITLKSRVRIGFVEKEKIGYQIDTNGGKIISYSLLIATGSSASGHKLAKSLGHTITTLAPSLFTFKVKSPLLSDLQGTSFPTSRVELTVGGRAFKTEGSLLITHWGLSGPAILKLSSIASRELLESNYKGELRINWNVLVTESKEEFARYKISSPKRLVQANPLFGFTQRFWRSICEFSGINERTSYAEVSKDRLQRLAKTISETSLEIDGKGEFKDEFVTCGGVSLSEINFKTMESKITPDLYFAGEILDIDGITGGFNFQNAWTTAWHAGMSIGRKKKGLPFNY